MAPRKKDSPSSSDSSSSNSSSSSSSSSTSSGSASSSSDSENSSTSGGKRSGGGNNPSSDSEKKTQAKKKGAPITTRSKSDASEHDKSKEKIKKSSTKTSSNVYTSDSDDSSPKQNNAKKKPQLKPKSSATVTPVPKNPKTASSKNVPKKLNPPRKVAQKSGVLGAKEPAKPSLTKVADDPKKGKTKSIFSPECSSDTEEDTSTPPPPKLTAMKAAVTSQHKSALANKPKLKPLQTSAKPRSSSLSSNSSQSSGSSDSSSESNRDSSRSKQGERRKSNSKKNKKCSVPPVLMSDADSGPPRKLTRSLSNRRSKHVVSRLQSESDSDTGSKTSITKSPVKKSSSSSFIGGPKGGPGGSRKGRTSDSGQEEERRCPVEGCDSAGHLTGRISKHFTIEACPIYHNLTPQMCKDAHAERVKRDEERKKGLAALKAGARPGSPAPEQKTSRERVRELRLKLSSAGKEEEEADGCKDRQPSLTKRSNKYDLRLFQEAQAIASEAIEEELKLLANVRYTKLIEMGKFEMEVWYQSPYPEDFARLPKLYICEYCLRYLKARKSMERHAAKCVWRHPPGEEVYRKDKISVWEVDGKRYKTYCQNLCLLAKFFLDHKTLYYDVEPFLFYVMTIGDSDGCHTVGYFSKEKNSFLNYNVSCILTLPPYQRQGYGRLLIDFSYLLTRVEGKIGSPEKPLSDLGLISYRSYWKDVLLEYLCNLGGKQISIKDISQEMAINSYDIVSTLQALGMMKYWKGKHIILKKQDVIEEYVERSKRRGVTKKEIDATCLKWTPFVAPSTPNSCT